MYRSPSLQIKEIMALCGGERDHYAVGEEDCMSEEYDLDSEWCEEGRDGRGIRNSLPLEICGLQREQHIHFSNQEYYRRLEELKHTHLRNMAELERMYISQGREMHGQEDDECLGRGRNTEARQSVRKLQRINSQEELDFHDTSSGSDQSELCGEDTIGELELGNPGRMPDHERTFGRDILLGPEEMPTQKQFWFQPKSFSLKSQERRSKSKVTVPKPFQMMLREEERKKHKVRTRSEIELENMLLKRELEELRECQKKFRASPAPAHIHRPLYEMISRRDSQRTDLSRSSSNNHDTRQKQVSAAASAQPFRFLERERRKKEAKISAELGNLRHKDRQQAFKARPMPSSVYGIKHRANSKRNCQPPSLHTCMLEREDTEGQSDPNSDLEPDMLQSKSDTSPDSCRPERCSPSKPVKKQIELSIEMLKEREWTYINPPQSHRLKASGRSAQHQTHQRMRNIEEAGKQ